MHPHPSHSIVLFRSDRRKYRKHRWSKHRWSLVRILTRGFSADTDLRLLRLLAVVSPRKFSCSRPHSLCPTLGLSISLALITNPSLHSPSISSIPSLCLIFCSLHGRDALHWWYAFFRFRGADDDQRPARCCCLCREVTHERTWYIL